MKTRYLLFLLLAVACKKHDNPPPTQPPPPASGPFVYVGGSSNGVGVYWKTALSQSNPVANPVTVQGSVGIRAIAPSGSDVYMAGQTGGYWKNDTFVPVTGAASIGYLALSGATVCSLGFDNFSYAAYWEGNSEVNIGEQFPAESTREIGLVGITVSNANVYVSTTTTFAYTPGNPDTLSGNYGFLWKNDSYQILRSGVFRGVQVKTGMVISGNDVCVAGMIPLDTAYFYGGGYWKNGVWTAISKYFEPAGIAGSGSDLYIAGNLFSPQGAVQAVCWKNGSMTSLPGGASATAVTLYGGDVYILGVDGNNDNVVWKNGVLFEKLGATSAFNAFCLAVGN